LDEVCGTNAERLPEYSDTEKLPIIYAVIKEVMRWRPNLAEAGVPHGLTEDMEFEGYHFQKGTVFSWNAWHIALSPDEYENPERFIPERYMNEHVYDVLEGQWGFGAGISCLKILLTIGRRVCTGYAVAARNMFIVFSRLLYCFDFAEDPVSL